MVLKLRVSVAVSLAFLFIGSTRCFSGSPFLVLNGLSHAGSVNDLVIGHNDSLISISSDKTMRSWNGNFECTETKRFFGSEGDIGGLIRCAISPTGDRIAIATKYSAANPFSIEVKPRIYILRMPEREILRSWQAHDKAISCIQFSPNGRELLSTCADGSAKLWDSENGTEKQRFVAHAELITFGVFSPDGSKIATVSADRTLKIWSVGGRLINNITAHDDSVTCVAWIDNRIVTGSLDRSIKTWTESGQQLRKVRADGFLRRIIPSSDPRIFFCAMGGYHKTVETKKQIVAFDEHRGTMIPVAEFNETITALTCNERFLFGADARGSIFKVDVESRSFVLKTEVENGPLYRVSIDGRDGHFLKFGDVWSRDVSALVKSVKNLSSQVVDRIEPVTPKFERESFEGFRIGKSENQEVLVEHNGTETVFAIPRDDIIATIQSFALLSSQQAIVATDRGLFLYDVRTGLKIQALIGHSAPVNDIAFAKDNRFFATASFDQTIVFWNSISKKPFLRFFTSGEDWVVWTPKGYYTCSPGGERLIAWQINRGIDEFAEVLPAVRFSNQLYRPDIVKKALELADADEAIRQLKANPDGAVSALPPEIEIISPKNGVLVDGEEIVVEARATARAGNPISWMQVRLNECVTRDGNDGESIRVANEANSFTAKWKIRIVPGKENRISVLAHSKKFGIENVSESVRVETRAETQLEEKPFDRLFVISVGITDYKHRPRLPMAKSDAETIAKKLEIRTSALSKRYGIQPLYDSDVNDESIQNAFSRIRALKPTASDLTVLFFAGHGVADAKGNYNFLYHDCPTDKEQIRRFGFSVSEFEEEMSELGNVLLMLDTCAAGVLTDDPSRVFAKRENVMTFVSSDRDESAIENSSLGMSYFAYAVCAAIDAKEVEGKRRVELLPFGGKDAVFSQPFVDFVERDVPKRSSNAQRPRMNWGGFQDRNFPLSIIDSTSK